MIFTNWILLATASVFTHFASRCVCVCVCVCVCTVYIYIYIYIYYFSRCVLMPFLLSARRARVYFHENVQEFRGGYRVTERERGGACFSYFSRTSKGDAALRAAIFRIMIIFVVEITKSVRQSVYFPTNIVAYSPAKNNRFSHLPGPMFSAREGEIRLSLFSTFYEPEFHPPLLTLFNGKGVNTGGTDRNLDARLQIRTTVDGFGCKKVIFFVFFHRLVARPVLRNNWKSPKIAY